MSGAGREVGGSDHGEGADDTVEVRRFYDDLADDYHLVYEDWERSVERQASALDRIVRERLGPGPKRILDCTAGIGTQALGLAVLGHRVVGSDLSGDAVERARAEAAARGLDVDFHRRDVRELEDLPYGPFDVVLSADNSLPHLLEADDLRKALRGMAAKVVPGGCVVVTLRDYDALPADRPSTEGPRVRGEVGARTVVVQLWDWEPDRPVYRLHHLVTTEGPDGWSTRSRACRYRAVTRAELEAAAGAAGLSEHAWLDPDDSGFFQPVFVATRPGRSPGP